MIIFFSKSAVAWQIFTDKTWTENIPYYYNAFLPAAKIDYNWNHPLLKLLNALSRDKSLLQDLIYYLILNKIIKE